jgi:hypothetical protein
MAKFPSPNHGEYQEGQPRVWAFNTRHGALATPLAHVGRYGVTLEFGDGSYRSVSLDEYARLQGGAEWFMRHPQEEAQ